MLMVASPRFKSAVLQVLDTPAELFHEVLVTSYLDVGDAAPLVQKPGGGKALHPRVVDESVVEQDGEGIGLFSDPLLKDGKGIVGIDGEYDNGGIVAVLVHQSLKVWHLLPAPGAPDSPEIHDGDFAD